MSSCMSRCGQCLHAYHTVVNVSMHVTWCQMSPYISHSGKCLHTCHIAVNVSMHVTLWSMYPRISHSGKCLPRGNAQAKVHQQRLTNVKKDKTSGNAQVSRYCWRCTFFLGFSRFEPVWTGLNNTLKDKFFNEGTQPHPNNPSAVVVSSMVAQPGYLPQQAYDGDSYFWAQTPLKGSTVDVTFSATVRLSRVTVFTGDSLHHLDILRSGVLEACTSARRTTVGRDCPGSQVVQLGQFVSGSIDVTLPPSTIPVHSRGLFSVVFQCTSRDGSWGQASKTTEM